MSSRHAVLAPSTEHGAAISIAASISVLGAATALSAVIEGVRWIGFVAVTIAVVVAVGTGLRAIRAPIVVVAVGQICALMFFLTAVFTRSGLLGILPGPEALQELGGVLSESVQQVRTGVPPVSGTMAILCLSAIAVGIVMIAVDTLATAAQAPAAAGLVLLCVFAVPASLADEMLPWWSFALGAGGFALLLVVDEAQRHRLWRGRLGLPSRGQNGDRNGRRRGGAGFSATAVTAIGLVVAIVGGATLTLVGTAGRLPGVGSTSGTAGMGIKPFTSLRGQLERKGAIELFRVRGLDESTYLRSLTLRRYDRREGWSINGPLSGTPVNGRLVTAGTNPESLGRPKKIDIETIGLTDNWLPVYGVPVALEGVPDGWLYDPKVGVVFKDERERVERYTQQTVLPKPTADTLRATGTRVTPEEIGAEYLELDVDPRISDLAKRLTAGARTNYDKVLALRKHFTDPGNGFTYSLRTVSGGDSDVLADFLFNGKTGYCEQFASAMAVLVRAVGIPARVAVGFSQGYDAGGYQVITTSDAHAWVEVHFPGVGWTKFDPTPQAGGRGVTAPYEAEGPGGGNQSSNEPSAGRTTTPPSNPSSAPTSSTPPVAPGDRDDHVLLFGAVRVPQAVVWWEILLLLAVAAAVGAAVAMRSRRKRNREAAR
ncbi:transglutaminaseTgpA domain-containing protein [Allokutzneria sp. A3M-2-11 16]|uniref:transglutaminase family protein n=1 Tax=Allokutzneria sp. A3M-2-11 16 TaxID=2962043 RepID=UPI0020B6E256|nr:transglutaminaseTgpA domain-containing protein [Allokutzneria sp. A3M-2-11 16]MCP3797779.1 transglutaminaseTgpA domain-containing protein [Allokutzneria sp. A3M-2-11 16]